MYLSNYRRTLKLFSHLTLNPNNILSYLRFSLSSRNPLEIGLPWWSLPAIRAIKEHLSEKHTVFEWGSGGSSIFLATYCKAITSVEQDKVWHKDVLGRVTQDKINNLNLLFRGINLENARKFLESDYAKALDSIHDVIVIDGEDNFGPYSNWSARECCFALAQKHINPKGGIIVVDDSWRYPAIRKSTNARELIIHEGIGPCRIGVTSTDFHYY